MYIKIQHIVIHTASSAAHTHSAGRESRSSRGCWTTLRKGKKFRGQKCLEIASLSQRPPKHTESYSSHLHLHLQTNFSHSRYSKQTSFWMETCATLITHVHTLCTHTRPHCLPQPSRCACSLFFLDYHVQGSTGTMLPNHALSSTVTSMGVPMSCFLFTKHWQIVPAPQFTLLSSL